MEADSRAEAIDAAARALRYRDLSRAELERRLERRGVSSEAVEEALAALERTGLVDDGRAASVRAEALAGRGHGDPAIKHDLAQRGYDAAAIEDALEALAPEVERARQQVARRGSTPATARRLAARGFDRDAIEAAIGATVADDGAGALP